MWYFYVGLSAICLKWHGTSFLKHSTVNAFTKMKAWHLVRSPEKDRSILIKHLIGYGITKTMWRFRVIPISNSKFP